MTDKDTATPAGKHEFSRLVNFSDISEKQPMQKAITAKPEECKALAKRLEILELSNLTADLTLKRRMAGHMVQVTGTFTADVVQECVVTLDPVPDHIESSFEAFLTDIRPPVPLAGEVEVVPEKDAPEFVENGLIDAGELVTQHVALELDPYPRVEGASHELTDEELPPDEEKTHRPFEALAKLKKD